MGARRSQASTPARDAAPVGDGPHDERLPARHVARGEDARARSSRRSRRSGRCRARRARAPSCSTTPPLLRAHEAHREEHELARDATAPSRATRLHLAALEHDAHGLERRRRAPPSPRNARVETAQSRSAPSSCERRRAQDERPLGPRVRRHARRARGLGISSSCVTLAAPCRSDVPTQSEPVSPPPMTTTRLPVARIGRAPVDGVAGDAPVLLRRGTPSRSGRRGARARGSAGRAARARPSRGRPRRSRAAAARRGRRRPTATPGAEGHAFGAHLLDARVDDALLHLEVGDAVAQQAADAVVALEDA